MGVFTPSSLAPFVSPAAGCDAAVIAVSEAAFGRVATTRTEFSAGEIHIEAVVLRQRILTAYAALLIAFVLGPEPAALIASIVAMAA